MRRRDLITLIGAAAVAPMRIACAQQAQLPVIGFLHSGSPGPFAKLVAAFREGLREAGYMPGQNVRVDFRWAEGNYELLPELALDLVRRDVSVIVAGGGSPAMAAKNATRTIPIVFISGGDLVGSGLVTGLERPGGNATGINLVSTALNEKRLRLLHELVPNTTLIAVLVNTGNPNAANQLADIQQAARSLGQAIHIAKATSEREIDAAFATFPGFRPDALFVAGDPFLYGRRNQIVRLAGRYDLPAVYTQRDFALAGGLLSFGADLTNGYRQAGTYAGRILDGAAPAELPVAQSNSFELAINLKTARRLDLTVPQSILAQATEVIE
jgi:putative ABC transport system substrate-binding protein